MELFDGEGNLRSQSTVRSYDGTRCAFELLEPLAEEPQAGFYYELTADEIAPVLAIRTVLRIGLQQPVPPASIRLGTTRGTNALITRRGARTAFVTTRGFRDALEIGYQDRPKLFELSINKRRPLCETAIEIDERVTADGEVLRSPDLETIRRQLTQLNHAGIESLAICFLHAYRFPRHEQLVGEIANEIGFANVSLSSEVSSLAKFVSRAETTVLDGYLNPVLRGYVRKLRAKLNPDSELRLVNSAGGLMQADVFTGKDSVLSGPAGGVVGFSKTAQAAGFEKTIGFDMGGTSTDVSRFDGRLRFERETFKSNVRIITPLLAIETVAAGGGSICHFDGVRLLVGPESAGADPGPACYGRGGPLTVTDLNLFLGRLVSEQFPFPLDRPIVQRRLDEIVGQIQQQSGTNYTSIQLAEGFLKVANANMSAAIRTISVAEGFDPKTYALVAFGGAAPQHACAVADELGIGNILIHPDAGILSAYGIGLSDVRRENMRGVYQVLAETEAHDLDTLFTELRGSLVDEMHSEGVVADAIVFERRIDLRYLNTEAYLSVDCESALDFGKLPSAEVRHILRDRFQRLHRQRYGYVQDRQLEIVAVSLVAIGASPEQLPRGTRSEKVRKFLDGSDVNMIMHGQPLEAQLVMRKHLKPGDRLTGPALIVDDLSTAIVDPQWQAEMLSDRQLLLTRFSSPTATDSLADADRETIAGIPASVDPTMLEIFNNQFASTARQMGVALQNTAVSVNVKERLDFSCAIFDRQGGLVVNAPHIPVHLGAMSETIRHVIEDNPQMRPGDIFVTNDPYRGGSHLPDVTVVTPVHSADGREIRFFVASRAHHAEIGGVTPGSMPPFSKNLGEEGVLISNYKLVDAGEDRFDQLRDLLSHAPYPSRNPAHNIADIQAQVAANQQGIAALNDLIERQGWPMVEAYMQFIQQAAEQKTRQAIERFPSGVYRFADYLDNGAKISVAITVSGSSIEFDFNGTDPVLPDNFNANRAIVSAAIIYCLRCLIGEDIPLNQGVLQPVSLALPTCLLNPSVGSSPANSPAMVAGNVETSQRVVDVILGALGVCAASQGTMNNVLFGDATFGYYETLCGGAGATATSNGADAVHTHMTNTRLTDPEILEQRFPVRLLEFKIREGSGGMGLHRGGNGVVRKIEFLKDLDLAILSSRRGRFLPYGINGGSPGQAGLNLLVKKNGDRQPLEGRAYLKVAAGDTLEIQTPGGGGFGALE